MIDAKSVSPFTTLHLRTIFMNWLVVYQKFVATVLVFRIDMLSVRPPFKLTEQLSCSQAIVSCFFFLGTAIDIFVDFDKLILILIFMLY